MIFNRDKHVVTRTETPHRAQQAEPTPAHKDEASFLPTQLLWLRKRQRISPRGVETTQVTQSAQLPLQRVHLLQRKL